MAVFEEALPILIRHEGTFVNDPADAGGATNFGISARTLAAYLHQPVSVDQMKLLSQAQAADIYKKGYWDSMNLDFVKDQTLATIIFDMAVLVGSPTVVEFIQESLGMHPDRILGSHTIASINGYVSSQWLGLKIIEKCQNHFIEICVAMNDQIKFLAGWTKRTQDLLELLITNTKQ